MLLKVKTFFICVGRFFKWSFMYWEDVHSFEDFKKDVIEAYEDAKYSYALCTDPEFLKIEKELEDLHKS